MIWLASYPRSGNTFVRNILYEVYGIESSVFHTIPNRKMDPDYHRSALVKTHELPEKLDPSYREQPVVYLIRDGRDAIVSEAWHRKNFHDPRSKVKLNMLEAVLAAGDSHFGGWARNVSEWMARADLVIRFEDLIRDPLHEVEKMRSLIHLPEARADRLPDFHSQKSGTPRYGRGQSNGRNAEFFRKGRSGGWKDEMPRAIESLFWRYHGPVMEACAYERDGKPGSIPPLSELKEKLEMLNWTYPERRISENLALLRYKWLA